MHDSNDKLPVLVPVRRGLAELCKTAIADWRAERDVVAIAGTLARLSDRRLALIGLRRDTLIFSVERMMSEAEEASRIEADVLQILAAAEDRAYRLEAHYAPPPEQRMAS